jgi:aryl-alcohol dehydrogenase-like predicted oxidoreductase
MRYTPFGNTGMRVSRLALGSMTFSRKLDADAAARVIREAIDRGVNLIDTADSYGQSEQYIGKALDPATRSKVFLTTKVFLPHTDDPDTKRNSAANITRAVEDSLTNLRTDTIDLYQLHHPDPDTPIDQTLAALDALVRQGKVRHVGCSNHYAWQIAYANAVAADRGLSPLVSVQCDYSLLRRVVEVDLEPYCRMFDLASMIYSPLAGGLLTGKYPRGAPPAKDARAAMPMYRHMLPGLESDAVHDTIDRLRPIAQRLGLSLNQLAVLWLLGKPWVTTVLVGGSRDEHFTSLYDIADRELDAQVIEELDELTRDRVQVPYWNQPYRHAPAVAKPRVSTTAPGLSPGSSP